MSIAKYSVHLSQCEIIGIYITKKGSQWVNTERNLKEYLNKDTWNHLVKDYGKTHTTEGSLWCNLCNREVPVPNGINSINQHAREEKSFRLVLNFAAKICHYAVTMAAKTIQ